MARPIDSAGSSPQVAEPASRRSRRLPAGVGLLCVAGAAALAMLWHDTNGRKRGAELPLPSRPIGDNQATEHLETKTDAGSAEKGSRRVAEASVSIDSGNAKQTGRPAGASALFGRQHVARGSDSKSASSEDRSGGLLTPSAERPRAVRPETILDGLEGLRSTLRFDSVWPEVLRELRWILATHPDRRLRDGKLAKSLCVRHRAGDRDVRSAALGRLPTADLVVLAAARAESAEFDTAARTASLALERWGAAPAKDERVALAAQLALYRTAQPYRDPHLSAYDLAPASDDKVFQPLNVFLLLGRRLQDREADEVALWCFLVAQKFDPRCRAVHVELANLGVRYGRWSDAVDHLDRALELDDEDPQMLVLMGRLMNHKGYRKNAIKLYRRALALRDDMLPVMNDLAWLLATHEDASARDGSEALALAIRACEATDCYQPAMLDTLAAAYAELSRFPDAIEVIDEALALSQHRSTRNHCVNAGSCTRRVSLTGVRIGRRSSSAKSPSATASMIARRNASSIVVAIIAALEGPKITFDMSIRDTLLMVFFTTIGISAKFSRLKAGGRALAVLVVCAAVFLVVQNVTGVLLAKAFGAHPGYGLFAGSVSLAGGHGTAIAWGKEAEAAGLKDADLVGIAFATFGLVAGGIIGGPIAEKLIKKNNLSPADSSNAASVGGSEQADIDPVTLQSALSVMLVLAICLSVGELVNGWLSSNNIFLGLRKMGPTTNAG